MHMEHLRKLPDESRLWIHGFRDPLSPMTQGLIHARLSEFLGRWKSHGNPVQAASIIETNRFLITAAYCSEGISGCSMDSYARTLKALKDDHGLNALETNLVFYLRSDGKIAAADHLDFFALVQQGEVCEDTPVFDTLVQELGELRRGGFKKAYKDSWHARTYGSAPATDAGNGPSQ
jgi:hypothetical protein